MASDYERFISTARDLRGSFFDRGRPITVARAPGWVDLLGGGAAYGGGLALGWPLGGGSFVALQPAAEPSLRLRDASGLSVPLPLELLTQPDGTPRAYAEAAGRIAHVPLRVRLAAGAWLALMREEFVRMVGGARILLHIADGPGWQSGLTAAIAQACVSAFDVRLAPRELGLSCMVGMRRAAGVSHAEGVLGPLVSVCAPGSALQLVHQQPAWLWGNLHLPHDTSIWALRVGDGPAPDSGLPAIAGEMAYRVAAHAADFSPQQADARWLGYLSNISGGGFEGRLRALLPQRLDGKDYVKRYGQLPGRNIEDAQTYPLQAAATLAIDEHLRARAAMALLRGIAEKHRPDDELRLVGELLVRSHWGQRAAGSGDLHADLLAERIDAASPAAGLFGARMPASACEATLVVLGRSDAEPALEQIAARYAAECGLPVTIYGGSSSGCSPAGTQDV